MIKPKWKLANVCKCLVISSGLVYMAGKKPKGLSLDDIVSMIEEHPNVGYYEKKIIRRVTLGDALQHNFDDLGKPKSMFSSIDLLRAEHERDFPRLPQTGGQLLNNQYKSVPRRVGNGQ